MSDDGTIYEGERFGFEVTLGRDYKQAGFPFNGTVSVDLPHQCNEWTISGPPYSSLGEVEPAEALADLSAFIAEAEQARAALIAFIEGSR